MHAVDKPRRDGSSRNGIRPHASKSYDVGNVVLQVMCLIRLEFLRGKGGAERVTLRQIKMALRAAINDIDRDEFVLTFKRGDKFIVPHKENNDDMLGNRDCCHVRMTVDRLNKLRQMSLDRTAGVCWK